MPNAHKEPDALSRFRILHLGLAFGLLALLMWKIGLADVATALRDVNPFTAAAVVALNAPVGVLFWVRSRMVLERLGHRIPARILLPVAILGNVAGSLTPASTGELLRTTILKSHADVTAKDAFALVLYERALSVYLMALGTAVVGAFVILPVPAAVLIAGIALPLLALPLVGPSLLGALPKGRIVRGPRFVRILMERAADISDRLECLLRDRRLLMAWSALTAVIFAVISVQFWMLARALSGAVDLREAWIALGASQLAAIASLLPLGLGAADASVAAILRRAGMTLEQGTAVAILVRATCTLPLGLAAFGCYVYLQRLNRAETIAAGDAST